MDIIKEIWDRSLPNFGYVIEMDNGRQCIVVLGGQTIKREKEISFRDDIYRRNQEMQQLYSKETLSVNDKKKLVELMDKMYDICEARQEGLYYREEQAAFIDKLSENEREQLEVQIQMLKDSRQFYFDYVRKR